MIIYEYLMKAIQDDARRAAERDRLLLEARRAGKARRQRLAPAARAGKIGVSENITLDGVVRECAGPGTAGLHERSRWFPWLRVASGG